MPSVVQSTDVALDFVPFNWYVPGVLQIEASEPAFTVGAGLMVSTIVLVAAVHVPLPAGVATNVNVTVPVSPEPG